MLKRMFRLHSIVFCIVVTLACAAFQLPASATSVGGTVVVTRSGCDYFLVETRLGFDLLEWYSGAEPDEGDVIFGAYETYGFHSVYDNTQERTLRVYVENYWIDEDRASDELNDKC